MWVFERKGRINRQLLPTPGDLLDPRIEPSLMSPALASGFSCFLFFTTSTTWEIGKYLKMERYRKKEYKGWGKWRRMGH